MKPGKIEVIPNGIRFLACESLGNDLARLVVQPKETLFDRCRRHSRDILIPISKQSGV
jgi:hypothetical protein